jgi:hypothetical protein
MKRINIFHNLILCDKAPSNAAESLAFHPAKEMSPPEATPTRRQGGFWLERAGPRLALYSLALTLALIWSALVHAQSAWQAGYDDGYRTGQSTLGISDYALGSTAGADDAWEEDHRWFAAEDVERIAPLRGGAGLPYGLGVDDASDR